MYTQDILSNNEETPKAMMSPDMERHRANSSTVFLKFKDKKEVDKF